MTPRFGNDYRPPLGAPLVCPWCEGTFLHHELVDVYEGKEDATQGLHLRVAGTEARVTTALAGNPSPRRHGLRIGLWCEGCGQTSHLTLVQHNGETYVDHQPLADRTREAPW